MGVVSFQLSGRLRAGLTCAGALLSLQAWASPAPVMYTTYGSLGLIEMPSARMATDGTLSLSASDFQDNQRYTLGMQILPWADLSLRYSGLEHFDPSSSTYYERSFAGKIRLWDEDDTFPAFAVGINDLFATGVDSGEYVVASKQFDNIDATIGMGWGRVGSAGGFRNPLAILSSSFLPRTVFDGSSGHLDTEQFFHGSTATVFGGLVWRTPLKHLTLAVEYSSDGYTEEKARGGFSPRSQVNFGGDYEIFNGVTVGLQYLYGRSIGATLSFELDPKQPAYSSKISPDEPLVVVRSAAQQQAALQNLASRPVPVPLHSNFTATAQLADALFQPGLNVADVTVNGRELILVTSGGDPDRACARTALTAAGYDISTVTLMDAATNKRTSCPVPRAMAVSPFLMTVSATDSAYTLPPFQSLPVIDGATGVSAPPVYTEAAEAAIKAAAQKQKIRIEAMAIDAAEVTIYFRNGYYFSETEAVARLTRILMTNAPPGVEKFRLISILPSQPNREFDILRGTMERAFVQSLSSDAIGSAISSQPAPIQNPLLSLADNSSYPRFSWKLTPEIRQTLFDPTNPFAVQLLSALQASVEIRPGLSLTAVGETSFYDNFVQQSIVSTLPPVRTDYLRYYEEGKNGISMLDVDYNFRLAPTVFADVKAGYLESMFAGAGGEVLWRPEAQRWAVGVDVYEVWQRNFDRLFGLQPYHVLSGHVSLYYESPWHGLGFALRAGRYLAGDKGVTFEVTRRFESGVVVGAFMTKTNVSSTIPGEGGFDKGFIIHIPLGWVSPIETQTALSMDLRPILRNGGQRLTGDTNLYDMTERDSSAELNRHRGDAIDTESSGVQSMEGSW